MSRNTVLKFLNTPEVTPCTPSPSFPTGEMSVLIIQVIMLSSIRMYLNESDTRNQHYARNGIVLFLCCRVLKFEIMGFFGGIMKKQHPKGLLAKNQQIGFEILTQLCSDDSIQIHLNLTQFITLRTESNLEGFVQSHQSKTGLGDNLPYNASFQQVGLSDVVLSKYPNKSHNFKNVVFMTSSLQNSIDF